MSSKELSQQWATQAFAPGFQFFPDTQLTGDRTVLPGDEPIELTWDKRAAEKRQEDFNDLERERAGVGKKITRFLSDDVAKSGQGMNGGKKDAMAAVSQMYQQAYNNQVTFSLDGEDVQFTQGELHDIATKKAQEAQEKLDRLRREGASKEEIERAEKNLKDYKRIAELTDPNKGKMTAEQQKEVQNIFNSNQEVTQNISAAHKAGLTAEKWTKQIEQLDKDAALGKISPQELAEKKQAVIDGMPPEVRQRYEREAAQAVSPTNGTPVALANNDDADFDSAGSSPSPSPMKAEISPVRTGTITAASELDGVAPFAAPPMQQQFAAVSQPVQVPASAQPVPPAPANDTVVADSRPVTAISPKPFV